jgi:hypothetical protein
MILDGDKFRNATLQINNLSKGGIEIPAGIENFDVGRDLDSAAALWNRPTLRLSGSVNTYVDNIMALGGTNFVPTADITLDGYVDIDDLSEMIDRWLEQ